jgi:NADP-dependent 3-hydroxy acid dehydrogenase YdfG
MSGRLNAVVTGASSGIGKAIAIAVASLGGSVCLVGQKMEALESVAETARASANSVSLFRTDLSIDQSIADLVRHIEQDFPSFDTLIHCAGAHAAGTIETLTVDQFDALFRINVRMPFVLTKALLPNLKRKQGQIVFINSTQGLQVRASTSTFAATQHALKAIANGLRDEVNSHGVRVLNVFPGRTATPRIKALHEAEGRPYDPHLLLQPEDIAKTVCNALQMPRTAEITNIEIRPLAKSY